MVVRRAIPLLGLLTCLLGQASGAFAAAATDLVVSHRSQGGSPTDGSAVMWGSNSNHQCDVPPPNSDFIEISAGGAHTLALKIDGSIAGWGYNDDGRCTVPPPNAGFRGVSAGAFHSIALRNDGSIEAWGTNAWGQCDLPQANSGFSSVAAGGSFSLALRSDGSVEAWGRNDEHQCNVPEPNRGFFAVSAGYAHSLGLREDGTVVAWGDNSLGQCAVPGMGPAIAVAAGGYFSLALLADSTLVAWGSNEHGECELPQPNGSFRGVSAGDYHSLAVRGDGRVVAWGQDLAGKLDVPDPNDRFEHADAGGQHSAALHPLAQGACCLHSFCTVLTEEDCQGFGGSYQGDAVPCLADICITSSVGEAAGHWGEVRVSPNPTRGATRFSFVLPTPGRVSVQIVDAAGQVVRTLADEIRPLGMVSVSWDGLDEVGREVAGGVYFVRVATEEGTSTQTIVLARSLK